MGLLSDQDISRLISAGKLVKGFDPSRLGAIKGAAIELTVGDVFVPGVKGEELGAPQKPRSELCLYQGQTAVIRSAEEISLGQDYAGIAFPAALVSLQGLLMTNPGYSTQDT